MEIDRATPTTRGWTISSTRIGEDRDERPFGRVWNFLANPRLTLAPSSLFIEGF